MRISTRAIAIKFNLKLRALLDDPKPVLLVYTTTARPPVVMRIPFTFVYAFSLIDIDSRLALGLDRR